MNSLSVKVSNFLRDSNQIVFSLYAIISAFTVYSCMYAFRKPFAVGTFEGLSYFGIDYKILLITAQVAGYTLSKFIGIKIISEIKSQDRLKSFLFLFLTASGSLLLFPLIPAPWNIFLLFTNGLPLGLIWGVVFSFLEGRRNTELLAAGLSVSFIFSSGFVKSIGSMLIINYGVSEYWMPFLTGLIFVPLLIISSWMLSLIPQPTKIDEELRTRRVPMNADARKKFFKRFSFGLIFLIIIYILFTTFRDLRDNFAAEIWASLGYSGSSDVFILTEIPVSVFLLILMSLLMFIKKNNLAFITTHIIIFFGTVILGAGSMLYELGLINGSIWMILMGTGLYMGYVPFNSMLFDRLIGTFQYTSNVGFLIYLADSFGYLGSVTVMLIKNFFNPNISWLNFMISSSYFFFLTGILFISGSMIYFGIKYKNEIVKKTSNKYSENK